MAPAVVNHTLSRCRMVDQVVQGLAELADAEGLTDHEGVQGDPEIPVGWRWASSSICSNVVLDHLR